MRRNKGEAFPAACRFPKMHSHGPADPVIESEGRATSGALRQEPGVPAGFSRGFLQRHMMSWGCGSDTWLL